MTAAPGFDAICSVCKMPAVWDEALDGWLHAEAADEAFCMVLRGIALSSEEDAP